MSTLLLGLALIVALAIGALVLLIGLVRLTLALVLLPFRLLFGFLLLPFWIARTALKAAGLVILIPLLGLFVLVTIVGGLLVVGLPLLVLGGILALLWMFLRAPVHPIAVG